MNVATKILANFVKPAIIHKPIPMEDYDTKVVDLSFCSHMKETNKIIKNTPRTPSKYWGNGTTYSYWYKVDNK